MLKYKGFFGMAEYDEEQQIITGRVINTRTVITFQADSGSMVEEEFRKSVDDYLEWCKEDGVEAEKPYSGMLNLRMKPELHRRAAIRAKKNGVSLNKFIEKAIEDELLKD